MPWKIDTLLSLGKILKSYFLKRFSEFRAIDKAFITFLPFKLYYPQSWLLFLPGIPKTFRRDFPLL